MEHFFYNSKSNLLYKYEPKTFTPKDLETGMFFIIESECFVVVGDKIVSESGRIHSKDLISEDMKSRTGKHIEKVYKDCCSFSDAKKGYGTQVYPVPLSKLTLSQIKDMIGFDFELVNE